ncbi:MAG: sugar phosphate isomerase/epimerase, partial [Halioglobus sp.]|nr:sugar phosphate isomerase/epimerase [Halioglobus sp.]
ALPESEQEITDAFGALCDRAAAEDLRVSLEFMPFTGITDLAVALRIVSAAGRDNGGIMLDFWHHHRAGGSGSDLLQAPGSKIFAVQLDDALAEPMADVMEETLNHRLLPGQGCIDLAGYMAALLTIGANPVYDVEVFNDALRSESAPERARQLYASCQVVL